MARSRPVGALEGRGPVAAAGPDRADARAGRGLPGRGAQTAASALFLAGVIVVLALAVLAGGGSSYDNLFPIGTAAIALALAGAFAVLAGLLPRPDVGVAGLVCFGALVALCVWTGVSISWSIAPDLSWEALNRSLVYLAFLGLGALAGAATRRPAATVAGGVGIVVAAALVWALLAKVFPGLDEDGGRIARLRAPVDFWNALAIVLVLGLPIALWLASDRTRARAARAGAAVYLYGLVVALLLTYSRGGILAGALAVGAWLAFARGRLESIGALVVSLPVAVGVFAFALRLPGVVDDGQAFDTRVADGRAFGLALLLGALVVAALAWGALTLEARRPIEEHERAALARAARLVALLVAAAAIVVLGVRAQAVGDWIERQADEFANPPTELVTQGSERLTSVSSNNRWTWWKEAWTAFETEPVLGTGAASFATVHQILRQDGLTVTEPHSVPLQFLSETGVVGGVLACAAGLAALVGCAAAVRRADAGERRRPSPERAPALALAVGVLAYAAHSLVDFDWSFLAATAPVLVATGALLASGRDPVRRRGSLVPGALGLLLAAAVVVSLAAPWLADRKLDDAYAALGQGRSAEALDDARSARFYNPLALDPFFAEASAQTLLGDVDGARATLLRAVELQPLDADAWYELGLFELDVGGSPEAALPALERAARLDPFGPAGALLATVRGQG